MKPFPHILRKLFLITLLSCTGLIGSGQIQSLEYFIDRDPGNGNGTIISSFTSNGNGATAQLQLPVGNLPAGFHLINFRAKDNNNRWGHYETRLFYVARKFNATPNIIKAEYFFDTDPGPGNAASVTLPNGVNITESLPIPIPQNLSSGIHKLNMRVLSNEGVWSHFSSEVFMVTNNSAVNQKITQLEYFFDADPGVGKGFIVDINNPGKIISITELLNVPEISKGYHRFYIRTKSNSGLWSHTEGTPLFVAGAVNGNDKIIAAEYFVNKDPGFGNGTGISINPPTGNLESNMALTLPAELNDGNNTIVIRVKNEQGVWSHYATNNFVVKKPKPGSGNNLLFAGSNQYAHLDDKALNNSYTIETWVKFTNQAATINSQVIGLTDRNNPNNISHQVRTDNNGRFVHNIKTSANVNITGTTIIQPGKWYHVAISCTNNGNAYLYINGIQEGTVPVTDLWQNGNRLQLAGQLNNTNAFNGELDEVKIWQTALSEQDIRAYMCKKITAGHTAYNDLVAYFNLDEGAGNALFDEHKNVSANMYNATWQVSGAPVGDISAYSYNGAASTATLQHITKADAITATIADGTPQGLHVYNITDTANHINGTSCIGEGTTYFGVFAIAENNVTVKTAYNYAGIPVGAFNKSGFRLYTRNNNSSSTWTEGDTENNTTTDILSIESENRSEYILSSSVVLPTVSIAINTPTVICANTTVTFTATTTNGGTAPVFNWFKNGTELPVHGASVTLSDIADNDSIYCTVISNSACVNPDNAASNGIKFTVTSVTPTIIISSNTPADICAGTNVSFTAVATYAGNVPVYQWYVNGNAVGTNAATLLLSNIANDDVVTCKLISNETCVTNAEVLSNAIRFNVTGNELPTIAIAANTGLDICNGTAVTISATITNGGTSPVYIWRRNGNIITGESGSSITLSDLANNDRITCTLQSNFKCVSSNHIVSNELLFTINSTLNTAVNITPSNQAIACAGSNITFNAHIVNGGTNPTIEWYRNNVLVLTGINKYEASTFNHNDAVYCRVVSSNSCAADPEATSNTIVANIIAYETPSLQITSDKAAVCSGSAVVFTAISSNAGTQPNYKWFINGNLVAQGGSTTFSTNTLINGDIITCELVSNYPCLNSNNTLSNDITITVKNNPVANAGTDQTILRGSSAILSASGGDSYLWSTGETTESITVSPNSTTTYTVTAFSSDGCSNTDQVTVQVDFSQLNISQSSHNYGDVVVNNSVTRRMSITNNGTLAANINSISVEAPFTVSFSSMPLEPGGTIEFDVMFNPVQTLVYQKALVIRTSTGNFNVTLTGKGVTANYSWAANVTALDYGNVVVSGFLNKTVSVSNNGNMPVRIDSIVSGDHHFTAALSDSIIPVGQSRNIGIAFSPSAVNNYNSSVKIYTAHQSLATINISVTGNGYIAGTKPVLDFVTTAPYNNLSGVDKPVANEGNFTYSIVYKQASGLAPMNGYPKIAIDLNGDNDFVDVNEGEFQMTKVGNGTDWINGETFIYTTQLSLGNHYGYQFKAKDINGNEAVQNRTAYMNGPLVTNQMLDLSIYANNINFSKTNPNVTETFTVSGLIENRSPYPASNVPVKYFIDSVFIGNDTIPFVPANGTASISKALSFDKDGFYPVKIWIDSANTITESNKLNNYAIRPVIVGQFSLPGAILTTANAVTNSCGRNSVLISGNAKYDGLNLEGYHPVLGATVTVTIENGLTLTTHTTADGYWSVSWLDFLCDRTYNYTVSITDYTLTSATLSKSFNKTCVTCGPIYTPVINHGLIVSGCIAPNVNTEIKLSVRPDCGTPVYSNDTTWIYVNDMLVARLNNGGLNPCEQVFYTTNYNFAPGEYNITYTTHFYDSAGNRTVLSGRSYALVEDKAELTPGNFRTTGAKSFAFSVFNNVQCMPAGAHTVHLYDSMANDAGYTLLQSYQVSGVSNRNSVSLDYSNQSLKMGYHHLRIVVDTDNTVAEYNEDNNSMNVIFYVPFPELSVSNIEMSNSDIEKGSVVNFTATVTNTGSNAGPFKVQFYANGEPFGIATQVDTMLANAAVSIISDVYTIPIDTCPIVITAHVDYLNEVEELTELNNTATMDIATDITAGMPCYGLGSVCNPYRIVKNSLVQFGSVIQNIGTRDINKNIPVSFRYAGETIGTDVVEKLRSKEIKGTNVSYSFANAGTYVIHLYADTANTVCELNENNNIGAIYIVVEEGLPDLHLYSEHISPSNLNPVPNQPVTVAASIFNRGNQVSEPTFVRFFVNDVQLGEDVPLNRIGTGRDTTVMATVTYSSGLVGPKVIKVVADPDNTMHESNKSNNAATRAIIVGAAPDFARSIHQGITVGAAPIRRAETVTVANYIRNFGGESGTAVLRFTARHHQSGEVYEIGNVNFSINGVDSSLISTNWLIPQAGRYTITTEILNSDPQEYNIHNNVDSVEIEAGQMLQFVRFNTNGNAVCTNQDFSLQSVISSDNQLLSFEWLLNDHQLTGKTNSEINIVNATKSDSGKYQLKISDNFGTVFSTLYAMAVNISPVITEQPKADVAVCAGNVIDLNVQAQNTSGYQWYLNNQIIPTGINQNFFDTAVAVNQSGLYHVVVKAMPGCLDIVSEKSSVTISALSNYLAANGAVDSVVHYAKMRYNYTDENCNQLASVINGNYSLGLTHVKTIIIPQLLGYVSRIVDIEPEHNHLPARVVLYYTQAEFDKFNVWAKQMGAPTLPESPVDTAVKFIVIEQYHGRPEDGNTGPGGIYDSNRQEMIRNQDLVINWDADKQLWTIAFNVSEFSGFYVTAFDPVVLPIRLVAFNGKNTRKGNLLKWQSSEEQVSDKYILQRSIDGNNFSDIATIKASGRASQYEFLDSNLTGSNYFYRLVLVDKYGKTGYSNIIRIQRMETEHISIIAFPNPAKDFVWLRIDGNVDNRAGQIQITDLNGRVLYRQAANSNLIKIPVQMLSSGVYVLSYITKDGSKTLKFNKE
ncbi:CARDB domain-containing protein [Polluticaenibacter yanchengensis]|uniref:Choice-of-anchor D domain-containing protein n=1 Tax=Polluticaenibacter yanchengensis TaxID=3014562 RepID=A0ABT4UFB8_9BACT|nr:choice-of-anchor D domain-containing protein [Chitinophagaceae bacterium LY-5]